MDRLPEIPAPHGIGRQARFGLLEFCNPVLQCVDWAKPATQANFRAIVIPTRGFQSERPAKPVLRALAAFLCVERGNLKAIPGKRRYGAVIKPQAGEMAATLRAELAGERKHQEQTAAALVKAEVGVR